MTVRMLLHKVKLENLLSFRNTEVELRGLNVLIGANASGKSNLIEAIGLLQAAPVDLSAARSILPLLPWNAAKSMVNIYHTDWDFRSRPRATAFIRRQFRSLLRRW
ncbi:MAG: AAA family ATPase [Bryobacteraceae bacterium]